MFSSHGGFLTNAMLHRIRNNLMKLTHCDEVAEEKSVFERNTKLSLKASILNKKPSSDFVSLRILACVLSIHFTNVSSHLSLVHAYSQDMPQAQT